MPTLKQLLYLKGEKTITNKRKETETVEITIQLLIHAQALSE